MEVFTLASWQRPACCFSSACSLHQCLLSGKRCLKGPHYAFFNFNFFIYQKHFVLGYSRLTMLRQFQVNSEGTQPHKHIYCFSSIPLKPPSRLAHNTEQSSMCYTIGFCWLSILNIAKMCFACFILINGQPLKRPLFLC